MHLKHWKAISLPVVCLMLVCTSGCAKSEKTKEAMELLENQDYQGAIALLDEAKSLGENERLISRGKGISYMGLADYEQAVASFEEALQSSNGLPENIDYDINYYMASSYMKLEKFDEAQKAYSAILALKPKEKDAYYLRGNARLALNDYEGAKADFDQVISMEPQNYDRLISIYEMLEHYGYSSLGKEYIQTALTNGEKNMKAYDSGRFYYYLGDYQKAYIALEEAKSKGGVDSYLYLGKAYEATGDYNYAASVYNSCLAKEGDNAMIYNQLGLCEMQRGDYRKALDSFQIGLKMEDQAGAAQSLAFNEVVAYEYLGEYDTAYKKIKSYVKKYPDDAEAKREKDFLSTR